MNVMLSAPAFTPSHLFTLQVSYMKTLSQNTTSSACAPETGLQQLVATIVPDEQRISFWPQHFGLIPQWVTPGPGLRLDGPSVKTTAVVSGICTP